MARGMGGQGGPATWFAAALAEMSDDELDALAVQITAELDENDPMVEEMPALLRRWRERARGGPAQ